MNGFLEGEGFGGNFVSRDYWIIEVENNSTITDTLSSNGVSLKIRIEVEYKKMFAGTFF